MKKRNLALLTAIFVLATGLLGGCSSSSGSDTASGSASGSATSSVTNTTDENSVLRLAIKTDIVSMDAHRTTNDYLVPMNVFDSLFTIIKKDDGATEIVKNLVDSYDISADGLVYDFTLKDGIVFSDGTPLTAEDVKFTFERILTLPDSAQTDFVVAIDGAGDLMAGTANELRGITVTDDLHFTITLAEPFAGFLAQLATPSTVIYSEKIVTEAGDDFGSVPEKTIGTGPYIVKEWNRGSGLVFESNPNYWGEEPSAKRVEVSVMEPQAMNMAFQKGDLDIIDCLYLDSAVVDATYKSEAYQDRIVSVDRMGLNYLMLNEKIEPLNNVLVRRAIQMAIDRESILQSIYSGDGKLEDGIYPSGCVAYCEDNQGWLKYDPQAAKALLAEAGYENGFDMEIASDSSASDSVTNIIQVIAQNLSDVGINATIQTMDHASWLDLRNSGDMSSFWAVWLLDFNDPDNILYTFFGSEGNTVVRSNNYPDSEVIARVNDARAIVDDKERMAEYAALEKKLVQEDAVWVPMFSLKHLYVKGERVESFTPHWAGWSELYFTGVVLK